jgi:hypothetical protein
VCSTIIAVFSAHEARVRCPPRGNRRERCLNAEPNRVSFAVASRSDIQPLLHDLHTALTLPIKRLLQPGGRGLRLIAIADELPVVSERAVVGKKPSCPMRPHVLRLDPVRSPAEGALSSHQHGGCRESTDTHLLGGVVCGQPQGEADERSRRQINLSPNDSSGDDEIPE